MDDRGQPIVMNTEAEIIQAYQDFTAANLADQPPAALISSSAKSRGERWVG